MKKTTKPKKNSSPRSRKESDRKVSKAKVSPRKQGKRKPTKEYSKSNALGDAQELEIFCRAIMSGKSQSDAYRESHPSCLAWEPASIHNSASAYSRRDEVVARLQELSAEYQDRYRQDVDRIMDSLRNIAFCDPRELFDAKGKPKPLRQLPDHVLAAISSVDIEDGKSRIRAIRKAEQLKAIEMLGKFYKIWTENHAVNFTNPLPLQGAVAVLKGEMSAEEASRLYRELCRGSSN
jgi:hypothetical protein